MHNDFMLAVQKTHDHARELGAINSISTTSSVMEDGGVPFVVRVVENLQRKEKQTSDTSANPFLPYDENLFVSEISPTHVCLLNKFNVVDHHLLFVTRQFESQQSLLTSADFAALWFGLRVMDGLVFYNSGPEAGASQKHKHLQMVPSPLSEDSALAVPMARCFAEPGEDEVICHSPQLPFSHAYARVSPPLGRSDQACAEHLHELYLAMLQTLGLWHPSSEEIPLPHNMLASRQWLWVVPRVRGDYQGLSVNALGFAGTLLVKSASQREKLCALGPMNVVTQVVQS